MKRWFGLLTALAAGALWWVLADANPSSTYHFAPAIVAGAWVVVDGVSDAGITPRATARLAMAGFLIAVLVTLLLESAGNLDGPVFWQEGDGAPVVTEHVLFAALGALGGAAIAIRRAARVSG